MRGSRRNLGLTLVETLGAILAVVLLAGIGSPLIASMSMRVSNSNEISQLHQLAVAQGIYTADTGGVPMSTLPLVTGKYVTANTCASPLDLTVNGITNAFDTELGEASMKYRKLSVPYRNSYLGIRECGYDDPLIKDSLIGAPNAGWLVSLTTSLRSDKAKWTSWYTGNYRRVMLDGSVKTFQHQPVPFDTISGHSTAEHYFFLFRDGSLEWKRKFISGSH